MSEAPFWPLPADDSSATASSSLEAQLEVVLERDGVPISVAPPVRVRRTSQTVLTAQDADQDQGQVRIMREKRAAKRPKLVRVDHEAHEASPYVVRMQGVVARPNQDRRVPFHRTMHRWETPFVEGVGLDRIFVQASDLWIEALDPEFFHDQFTPGDVEVAYRESQRGWWTRLRRPFILWHEPPAYAPESRTHAPSSLEAAIITAGDVPVDQAFADSALFTVPIQHESEDVLAALPEIEAMATASEPVPATRSRWRERFSSWRERARDETADLREREQEVVAEVEEVWHAPYLEPRIRVTRVFVGFLGMLCLVALPAGAVSWSRSIMRSVRSVQRTASELASPSVFSLTGAGKLAGSFAQIQTLTRDIEQSHGLALALAQALPTTRDTAETVEALLEAGQEASQAGTLLSQGVDRALAGDVGFPSERLVRFRQYLSEAQPHLDRLFAAADRIHPEALPSESQERARQVRDLLLGYRSLVSQADTLSALLLALVGQDEPRTYLILFQNPAELRPSGGFMGSYAELVLDRGAIHKLDVPGGGTYDLRSQLRARWEPPAPLQLVGARWEFQDANWSPDFGVTADTVRTFWRKAAQPTLDGVIAVNASLLPKLLTVTGPIQLPAYGKTVNAENVLLETQKAVELEYDRAANQPKAFIGDLNREVLHRLQALPSDQWIKLATIAAEALDTKEIQISLSRPAEQGALRPFGWTGEWPMADAFDQLAVIGANIAGQKSSQAIQETVQQTVHINDEGFIDTNVQLTRQHLAAPGTLFQGVNNVEYLRLFTPLGAQLTAATGFQTPSSSLFERPTESEVPFPGLASTTESHLFAGETVDVGAEAGRQVFGGWIQLRPGQRRTTEFSYHLPRTSADMARALADEETEASTDSVSDAYVLHLISQSGAPREHKIILNYPATWHVLKASPVLTSTGAGKFEGDISVLDKDQFVYVLFRRDVGQAVQP